MTSRQPNRWYRLASGCCRTYPSHSSLSDSPAYLIWCGAKVFWETLPSRSFLEPDQMFSKNICPKKPRSTWKQQHILAIFSREPARYPIAGRSAATERTRGPSQPGAARSGEEGTQFSKLESRPSRRPKLCWTTLLLDSARFHTTT
jgi:hypothetical protein